MAHVLITGANSGFGLLAALTFARNGHAVTATMRTPAKGVALEAAIAAEGLPITLAQLDVNDPESVTRAVAEAETRASIEILVNNAGWELNSPIEHATDDEIRAQFETNVLGPVRLIRAVLPAMRGRRSGVIVNVSSVGGIIVPPFAGYYAASKHALEAVSEALHYEAKPFGVRVAVVEPGGFSTSFTANVVRAAAFGEDSPYARAYDSYRTAFERFTPPGSQDPQLVADAIYAVATTPSAPLRTLVGNDAQSLAAVRKQLDFEGFEQAARTALNFWD